MAGNLPLKLYKKPRVDAFYQRALNKSMKLTSIMLRFMEAACVQR